MPVTAQADPSTWAASLYAQAMERVNEYRIETRSKVMAACIRWPDSAEGTPEIKGVGYAVTEISSEVNVRTSTLRRNAQNRCIAWEANNNLDCTCEFLDVNGRNVLQVPE
ncbi:MAG: hypothetical protein AAGC81_00740 [Pseudomonadota bacterium]